MKKEEIPEWIKILEDLIEKSKRRRISNAGKPLKE